MYEMQGRGNKLLSERRAVSAFPGQRGTGEFAVNAPMNGARSASAPPGKRTLPLSCTPVVFNNWLSRASSAISVQSMRTSSSCYSTSGGRENPGSRCHSSCSSYSRPTRTSMLRQRTCPVRNEQPNYQEVIKKRKAFTLRCKSLSASNVRCKTLPNGESLHAFITGARYNRAHHMDSRSLERVGVYIPRRDATRSFVNPSGIQPPSPEIYGAGSKAQLNVTDQLQGENGSPSINSNEEQHEVTNAISATNPEELAEGEQSSSNDISDSHKWHPTLDKQSNNSNHAKEVAAGRDANSVMKPGNERYATSMAVLTPTSPASQEMVSGRAQDPKECASSWNEIVPGNSVVASTPTSPASQEMVSGRAQDPKECASSWNEIVPGNSVVASSNSSDVVVRADRKHVNIEESSSPQHSRAELPTAVVAEDVIPIQQEHLRAAVVHVVNGDGSSEDEMISPEARALITDEILKECQRSSSSFASSSVYQETEIMQDNVIEKDSLLPQLEKQADSINTHTNTSYNGQSHTQSLSNNTENETTSLGENLQDGDLQAAGSERELSAKSSCIFVDMSTLNLDQVQEEETMD